MYRHEAGTPYARTRMHVVLLNQAFHPDVVATAQMGKDLADHLVRAGHRVTAVSSRSIYGKKGAVLAKREEIAVLRADGTRAGVIEVRRVGFSLFGKASIAARIADFALFYVLATLRVLTLSKPDVVVSYTTPPFIALVGLLCKWLRGSKAVYWVMDLYPDTLIACGVMRADALPTRVCEKLNRFLLKQSDADVVLGRCMRDLVQSKGVPASKVVHIPVWSDLKVIGASEGSGKSAYRAEWGLGDSVVVMYSGNFGLGHDATTICGAMELLRDRADICFVFVGGGKRRAEVEAWIKAKKLTNAQWREYVPRERLNESLGLADVHLISLKQGAEGIMVPSKLFGIMAVARAGIFVGDARSEIARVLADSGGGVTVREGDSAGLAREIAAIADDRARRVVMGNAAAAYIKGRYDVASACAMWERLLVDLHEGKAYETAPLKAISARDTMAK